MLFVDYNQRGILAEPDCLSKLPESCNSGTVEQVQCTNCCSHGKWKLSIKKHFVFQLLKRITMQQTGEKVNNNLNDRSQYHKPHKPKKHPKLFRRLITAFSNDRWSGNQHFKPATDMIRMHINRDRHTKKFNRPRCKCCNTARLSHSCQQQVTVFNRITSSFGQMFRDYIRCHIAVNPTVLPLLPAQTRHYDQLSTTKHGRQSDWNSAWTGPEAARFPLSSGCDYRRSPLYLLCSSWTSATCINNTKLIEQWLSRV